MPTPVVQSQSLISGIRNNYYKFGPFEYIFIYIDRTIQNRRSVVNLDKLQCFIDIVKLNSFTKAADKNCITQAAISQQISSMESELDIKLFNRSKRGFSLTDAGQSFYSTCEKILSTYSRGVSRAKCIAHNSSGFISIGIWPGFDKKLLVNAIMELMEKFTDCEIIVREGDPITQLHYHRESKLALTIAMPYDFYNNPADDMVVSRLTACGFNLCVSENHPLAGRKCISISEVLDEKFAVLSEDYIGNLTAGHIATEQIRYQHLPGKVIMAPNFETQQLLVASEEAVMLLPELCKPDASLPIRVVKLADYPEKCEFAAIWKSANASPALTCLVDLLSEKYESYN